MFDICYKVCVNFTDCLGGEPSIMTYNIKAKNADIAEEFACLDVCSAYGCIEDLRITVKAVTVPSSIKSSTLSLYETTVARFLKYVDMSIGAMPSKDKFFKIYKSCNCYDFKHDDKGMSCIVNYDDLYFRMSYIKDEDELDYDFTLCRLGMYVISGDEVFSAE